MAVSRNGKMMQQSTMRKLGLFIVVQFLYCIYGQTLFSMEQVHKENNVDCTRTLGGSNYWLLLSNMYTRLHFEECWLFIELEMQQIGGEIGELFDAFFYCLSVQNIEKL